MIPNNLRVINIGLRLFYQSLTEQKIEAVHINWEPKPKLEKDIEDILDKIDMWEYQKIVEIHDRFEIPKWFQEKDSDSNWWKCNFTKGSNWYI